MTEVRPGIRKPCSALSPTRVGKLGARPHSSVGTISSVAAPTITGLRPMRSERGPATSEPPATASTTEEMVRPAAAGERPKARPSTGRIDCVVYMSAKTPAVPRKSANHADALSGFGAPTARDLSTRPDIKRAPGSAGEHACSAGNDRPEICRRSQDTVSWALSVGDAALSQHYLFGLHHDRTEQVDQRHAGGKDLPVPLAVVPVAHGVPQHGPGGEGLGAVVVVVPLIQIADQVAVAFDARLQQVFLVQGAQPGERRVTQGRQAEAGNGIARRGDHVGVVEYGAELVGIDDRHGVGVLVDAVEHIAAYQVLVLHESINLLI